MRYHRNQKIRSSFQLLRVSLLWLATVPFCLAQSADPGGDSKPHPEQAIAPPDVFVQVALMRSELELIRREMGKPKHDRPEIGVAGAAPHEVYFQALTMFRKSERLCFEQTREVAAAPVRPSGAIRPSDVYQMVRAALERVEKVKEALAITEVSGAEARDETKTPTDVFRAVVQANHTLNGLLEKQFSPSDVYQQVTLGVGYAARLLERFPGAERIPPQPAWERRKRPTDVIDRMAVCLDLLHDIAETSGLSIAELEMDETSSVSVQPGEVYDVASLLVADLAFLHSQLKESRPPRDVFHPGRKLPSHVFQRVGILEAQLTQLREFAAANPDWLKAEPPSGQP